jgi:hypothetical protein
MKLFLLNRNEWVDFDQTIAFVIRADSAREARKLANDCPNLDMAEGQIWEDTKRTKCREIKVEGKKEIVLRSFKNG